MPRAPESPPPVIEEIKDAGVITSYTRWVDAVPSEGSGRSGSFCDIQSAIRAHLARIKEAPFGVRCREARQYWTPKSICPSALRLGEKVRLGQNKAHFLVIGATLKVARAGVG